MRLTSGAVILILFIIRGWTVNAQLDSTGVFRTVREFSDANRKELAVIFGIISIASAGCTNANIYRPKTAWWSTHSCQDISTYSALTLVYIAGLDPIETAGAGLIANTFFVGLIKYAHTGRFVNPDENCQYDSFGWERRKVFCGNTRYVEPIIGLVLLFYKKIIKIF